MCLILTPKLKDSYTAPYQDKQRYWTGMLLLFRGGLFLAFAVNTPSWRYKHLLCITIASLTIAWNQGSVYKRWYLDVLEAAVVYMFVGVNLGIFTVLVTWQLKEHFGFPNVLKRQTAAWLCKQQPPNQCLLVLLSFTSRCSPALTVIKFLSLKLCFEFVVPICLLSMFFINMADRSILILITGVTA